MPSQAHEVVVTFHGELDLFILDKDWKGTTLTAFKSYEKVFFQPVVAFLNNFHKEVNHLFENECECECCAA